MPRLYGDQPPWCRLVAGGPSAISLFVGRIYSHFFRLIFFFFVTTSTPCIRLVAGAARLAQARGDASCRVELRMFGPCAIDFELESRA